MSALQSSRNMRVLLTGSGGQLGQALVHSTPGDVELCALTRIMLDITQPQAVEQTIATLRPHVIMNAAAYNDVDGAEQAPNIAHAVNALGVHNLAQAAQQHGAALIHLSTDYVFDGMATRPYTEQDAPNPINVYGASKRAGEVALLAVHAQALVVRTSSVFSNAGNNFMSRILQVAMQRNTLRVVDDQVSCPTAAVDLASALWQLVQHYAAHKELPWGVLHYAGARACSRYAWAQEIIRDAQEKGLLKTTVEVLPCATSLNPGRATRPHYSVLDCSRIKNLCGIDVSKWEDACQRILAGSR